MSTRDDRQCQTFDERPQLGYPPVGKLDITASEVCSKLMASRRACNRKSIHSPTRVPAAGHLRPSLVLFANFLVARSDAPGQERVTATSLLCRAL